MGRADLMLQCIVTAWDRGHAFHHGDLETSLELAERIYEIAMAKAARTAKSKG
ncbi:MAG: hypothetical protein O2967_17725 [Proteobacteria bacterium]|nr:hypothetical protein [Pseudomonadota bacterium]